MNLTPDQQAELARIAADPFYFQTHYCYTRDPHNLGDTVRLMPKKRHIEALDQMWMNRSISRGMVDKSRQMVVSISLATFAMWEAMTVGGLNTLVQSDVMEKAAFGGPSFDDSVQGNYAALLAKMDITRSLLPEWLKESVSYKISRDPPWIGFGHEPAPSIIGAVSSNFSPAAGKTLSRMFADEISLQPSAAQSYGTASPALGVNPYWAIGTIFRRAGERIKGDSRKFQRMITFDLQHPGDRPNFILVEPPWSFANCKMMVAPHAKLVKLHGKEIPGMWWWKNPRNGFVIVVLHYSADPDKDMEWAEKERKLCADEADWLTHYEIQWDAIDANSLMACPAFTQANITKCPYDERLGVVYRGIDYGKFPACVFAQVDEQDCLRIFDAYVPRGRGTLAADFARGIVERSAAYGKDFVNISDAAGTQGSDKSWQTSMDILLTAFREEADANGRNALEVRMLYRGRLGKQNAEALLNLKVAQRKNRRPGLMVDDSARTQVVIDCLSKLACDDNGVRLHDNELCHPFDAVKYLVANKWRTAEDILSSDQPIIVQDTEPVDFETWYVQRLDQRNEREMAHLAAQEEIDAEGIDF